MIKGRFSKASLWVLGLLCATSLWAKPTDFERLQGVLLEIERASQDVVGGAMAVVLDDKVVYKKTFGRRKVGESTLVDVNTLFSLASVSKPIVATALAALDEKKRISLGDKVTFEGISLPLTQVLSHTTGFKMRGDLEIEKGLSRAALLRLLSRQKRERSKGEGGYFYSNLVFSLSEDFAASKGFEMQTLLDTLSMGARVWPLETYNVATPHGKDKGMFPLPSTYHRTVMASAGVFASLEGMISFLHIILGNRPQVISQKTLSKLFAPRAPADDVFKWQILPFKRQEITSSYGLGWRRFSLKGVPHSDLIFHSGFINGATAFVGIIPRAKMGIVILDNESSRFPLQSGLKIWKTLVGNNG